MRDRIGLAVAACALLSCASPVPAGCSGEVARLDAAPRRLHLRVLLERDGSEERHEAVVRVRPGRIEAIGLTPMGTQAWRLVHDRDGVEVENRIGRHLGLSPWLAYDAIAHALLAADAAPATRATELERPACGYRARVVALADAPLGPEANGRPPTSPTLTSPTNGPDAPHRP